MIKRFIYMVKKNKKMIKSVSEIKRDISNKNSIQTIENNKYIINKLNLRKNIREKWSLNEQNYYNKFLLKLNMADKKIKNVLIEYIVKRTENCLKKNLNTKSFKIWIKSLVLPDFSKYYDFKILSILYGFWEPKSKNYSRIKHFEAGIFQTPLEYINIKLAQYGYKIEDISNTGLSFNTVWIVHLS